MEILRKSEVSRKELRILAVVNKLAVVTTRHNGNFQGIKWDLSTIDFINTDHLWWTVIPRSEWSEFPSDVVLRHETEMCEEQFDIVNEWTKWGTQRIRSARILEEISILCVHAPWILPRSRFQIDTGVSDSWLQSRLTARAKDGLESYLWHFSAIKLNFVTLSVIFWSESRGFNVRWFELHTVRPHHDRCQSHKLQDLLLDTG